MGIFGGIFGGATPILKSCSPVCIPFFNGGDGVVYVCRRCCRDPGGMVHYGFI